MKLTRNALMMLITTAWAMAGTPTDFSGLWEFNPAKSQNVGMMAQMKMTTTIKQSASALDAETHASMQGGMDNVSTIHLDLNGKTVSNDMPMSGSSDTVTKWDGKKLVTTWTSQGAVAGSTTVRTETRALSADGKILTVESVRGTNPPLVMVYEKK
jgi:hypothetical protein